MQKAARVFALVALALSLAVFAAPITASADVIPDRSFIPIVPIAGITDAGNALTFPQYVNQLFKISISIGAMLAVLMLVLGGFEYMTGVKAGDKKHGLERIQGAVTGLVLLLSVYLILYIINPCILNITVLTPATSECSPIEAAPDPADNGSSDRSNDTQGTQTSEIPRGACLRDATFACGTTQAARVCTTDNNTRYFTPPDENRCITGNDKYMCAGGCPGTGTGTGTGTNNSVSYPLNLNLSTFVTTADDDCPSGKVGPYPACVTASVGLDPFAAQGQQPTAAGGCENGRVLRYVCINQ